MFRPLLLQSCLLTFVVASTLITGCNPSASRSLPETTADQPPDSSASKQESATDGIADTLRKQTDLNISFNETDSLPNNINDLMTFLARKQTEQMRPDNDQDFYKIQLQRAAASKKLLEMKINKEQRFEFVQIRLDSLLKLIGVGDPQAQLDFQKFISEFSNDQQPRVRQAVAVAGLINDYHRRVGREMELQPVIDAASLIAEDFPDSFDVCRELGNIGDQMLQRGDRKSWQQLARMLVNRYQNSADETCRNYTQKLAARVQVADTNLDLIVNAIKNQEAGAFDKYRRAVTYLFSDAGITLTSIEPIIASLRWLESTGMNDETLEANRIVTAASLQITNKDVRETVRENCSLRDTRVALVGKPFSIAALSVRGHRFDWSTFSKDHSVMVIFWSPAEPASVKAVQQMAKYYEAHKAKGLKLLAVNLSSDADAASLFGDELPEWEIVKGNPTLTEGPSEFIGMFGVDRVPQLFLVDRSGTVVSLNPTGQDLESGIADLVK